MTAPRRLSLDHITAVDSTPSQLVEAAAATGCAGVCAFLHAMPVLPDMPEFSLISDPLERRRTRAALRDTGVTLDLVYPFTLSRRSSVADFEPALESAAWLGGRLANVLCYEREPERRMDRLAALAYLARSYGIGLAIEFYPPSQIASLAQALDQATTTPDADIGITCDLLHLVRAGETPTACTSLADPRIRIAQLSDGPPRIARDRMEWEGGLQRALPGSGSFDIAGFVQSLPDGVVLSVEVPQESGLRAGLGRVERAALAVSATRTVLAGI